MNEDEADILGGSLDTLYGYTPIAHSSANDTFTYTLKPPVIEAFSVQEEPAIQTAIIKLQVPDTAPANWSLHASSVWVSASHVADNLHRIEALRPQRTSSDLSHGHKKLFILELGAGAGLPSILISSLLSSRARVVVSDYPDPLIIRTLAQNITTNGLENCCKSVGYAWGEDTSALQDALCSLPSPNDQYLDMSEPGSNIFDVVVAADTLWNTETHTNFIKSLCMTLKKSVEARVYLVAGFHTGRWTVQAFLERIKASPLIVLSLREYEVEGHQEREWDVNRADGEDEKERRRWVVWLTLGWSASEIDQQD